METLNLAAPFKWAVVRLATYVENSTAQPRLLFGSASLLANERPKPKSGADVDKLRVGKGKAGSLFFRRTVLSASEAVAWYRSGSSGALQTPVPTDPGEVNQKLDGQPIMGADFFDDPAWPALGIPAGADLLSSPGAPGDPAPFIGAGSAPARIHRRFGNNLGFQAVVNDTTAIGFLKRRLHIDLADYAEYLGSLVLIVPNPIVRSIGHFTVQGAADGQENLVFRLIPRADQVLDGLSFTVIERRGNLLSRFETMPVPSDGLIVVNEQLPVEQSGYVLTHPDHGVLVYQPPLSFVRSIQVSMGVVGRRVEIEAPSTDSPSSASAGYTVHEISHEHPIKVGDEAPMPNLVRVVEGEIRRERRAQARRYDQTWFSDGDRDTAIAFIRGRIGRARDHVMIADPYFGGWDQMRFLHAVHRIDVGLTILTSRLAFEALQDEDDVKMRIASRSKSATGTGATTSTKGSGEALRLEAFARALETFGRRGIKNVSAYVLLGKIPSLHDRFLVVDNAVWFLGNSLNALGSRASMILRVPDAESILAHLGEMKKKAIPFDQYREQRLKPVRHNQKS